jgi:hypothetical protein
MVGDLMALFLLQADQPDRTMVLLLGELQEILIPLAGIAMIVMIVWLTVRAKQEKARAQADFHKQLVDKFASGGDFASFLNSASGQRLLEGFSNSQVNAKQRILRSTGLGIVASVVGLGLLGLGWTEEGFFTSGVIVLTVGLGYLISAAVSYRLSQRMGLLKESEPSTTNESLSQT